MRNNYYLYWTPELEERHLMLKELCGLANELVEQLYPEDQHLIDRIRKVRDLCGRAHYNPEHRQEMVEEAMDLAWDIYQMEMVPLKDPLKYRLLDEFSESLERFANMYTNRFQKRSRFQ